jgi:acyl-CoA thioester hydrolase
MRFCERDRSEAFFKHNLTPTSENAFFVVKNLNANFIGSARLGDEVEIKTHLQSLKKASVLLLQEVILDNNVIFSMEVKIAYVKDKKVSKIPPKYLSIFEEFITK